MHKYTTIAKVSFKTQSGNFPELFPINIFDLIPDNHPSRLVDCVVNQLDIRDISNLYLGGGCSAYHPRMMIKVLFNAYLSNIYSCRKIAKALTENIHFMYISGNSTPNFRTFNEFRGKILKEKIKDLFAEVVKILVQLGCISLDVQYANTTIIGNSNLASTVPADTSRLYGKNISNFLRLLINNKGILEINLEDEILKATLITFAQNTSSQLITNTHQL